VTTTAETGTIFDIERFSTHDGPGTRTTVFLKGCFLKCAWCHNPEAMDPAPELMYDEGKCIHCLTCFTACPSGALSLFDAAGGQVSPADPPRSAGSGQESGTRKYDATRCDHCGACVEACYAEALEMVGRAVTAPEVYAEVERDRAFYQRTGGGVTISGGEPLYQQPFVLELLRQCREGDLHTALDTTAFGKWEPLADLLELADLVLLDLKLMDGDRHRAHTGVDNATILRNARQLARHVVEREGAASTGHPPQNTGVWIRVPVIPMINDDAENLSETARFVREDMDGAVKRVELLGYHQLGGAKFQRLGRPDPLPAVTPPRREELRALAAGMEEQLRDTGIEVRAR